MKNNYISLCKISILFCWSIISCAQTNTLNFIDKSYGTQGKDGLRNVLVLENGGYLLTGWINQTSKNHVGEGYLLNIDSRGTKRWEKTISTIAGRNRITNIFKTENNGFLIVVEEFPAENDPGQVALITIDQKGTILNKRKFGNAGIDIIEIMRPSPDGGFVFVGESALKPNGDRQAWVGKLSNNLDVLWQHHIGNSGKDRFTDCTLLPDGSFVAIGYIEKKRKSSGFYDSPLMMKFDSSGNTIWSKEPKFENAGALRGIALASNHQLALVGYTRNIDGSEFDAWVGVASTEGEIIWNKTLKAPGFNNLMAVEKMPDDTFVAIGSGKNGKTSFDALLVQFSNTGDTITSQYIEKEGAQFGRVAYSIHQNSIVIGGFNSNDKSVGDQLWICTTKTPLNQSSKK